MNKRIRKKFSIRWEHRSYKEYKLFCKRVDLIQRLEDMGIGYYSVATQVLNGLYDNQLDSKSVELLYNY